jgi:methionyl-tRNA formyltransferase
VTFVLFCNTRYGHEFELAFRAWCAARNATSFAVVRSLRGQLPAGDTPRARLRRRLFLARQALRDARSRRRGENVLQVADVNSAAFGRRLRRADPPLLGVVAGFNQIFAESTIERFDRLWNFHPSLLPYYRGPVPSYWCIRNGEEKTGITLHEVSARIDAGRILWQEVLPIATADPDELDRQLSRLGAAVLGRVLDHLAGGTLPAETRVDAAAVYRCRVDYRSFPRSRPGSLT